ncbi:MAG: HisA/HisF-related TIM barrel protein [Nitrososphaerales archaeon]
MRIIPVVDIMRGVVVQAVKGYREEYRPLETDLSATADPVEVASGLKSRFGFDELYTADLDGIMRGEADLSLLARLCRIGGMKVTADAGVNSPSKARALLDTGVASIIVGTETLGRLKDLAGIIEASGSVPVTGSIDVKDVKVVSKCVELKGVKPPEAARMFEDSGVEQLILLDVSRVGSEVGVDVGLVEETVGAVGLPLLVGGGVASIGDILALRDAGASGVLVATALYRGRLSRRELDTVRGVG